MELSSAVCSFSVARSSSASRACSSSCARSTASSARCRARAASVLMTTPVIKQADEGEQVLRVGHLEGQPRGDDEEVERHDARQRREDGRTKAPAQRDDHHGKQEEHDQVRGDDQAVRDQADDRDQRDQGQPDKVACEAEHVAKVRRSSLSIHNPGGAIAPPLDYTTC